MSTLLLSDLHLPPEASPLRERFRRFLEGPARQAHAVYLLGDIFEYWIGDDVGLQVYAREVAALASLTAGGVPVWFQHGNRDFLVGGDFFQLTGVRPLADPQVVSVEGRRILLSHGDVFCTDDVAYQRWRRFSRNGLAQWVFRRLSRARREKIAGGLRSGSDSAKRNKAEAIMDVNQGAIHGAFSQYGVREMIHGHTHRPMEHRIETVTGVCTRRVLPDWRADRCEYLSLDDTGLHTHRVDGP